MPAERAPAERVDGALVPMPYVLMYHSVEPFRADPFQVTVRPERFERQLRWLRDRGLRGSSVRELLKARRAGDATGLVGLTFDDGYADFVTAVMPVLARYGFTATVFIVAGALGGYNAWDQPGPRKRLMTAEDVRHAADRGMEVGSHGLLHRRLPGIDERHLADEVAVSQAILDELVPGGVTGFCYPYGDAGKRELTAVHAAGYGYACSVRPSALDSRLAIPRTFIGDRDGSARLFAKWIRHRIRGAGGGTW